MGENSDGDASSTLTETSDAEESVADEEAGSGGADGSAEESEETEYELSSDYEILPEGTTEEDVAAEEEYDYAADADSVPETDVDEEAVDGSSGDAEPEAGAAESGEPASVESESVDAESAESEPAEHEEVDAKEAVEAGFNKVEEVEREDHAETAADEELKGYESPDVSLDPAELDPEEEDEPSVEEELAAEDEGLYDPVQDEEMPLAAHIEEMVKRLGIVLLVAGAVSLVVFFTPTGNGTIAEVSINFLWDSVLPADKTTRPTVYGPLSLIMTEFKVASLAGVIVAMPVLVYQSYKFMKPGLYPHERRYYLAAVPTSLVLAVVGVAFAYTPVLPLLFQYFFNYTETIAESAFGLTKTFNLILAMMGYFAVIFQIPLFIMLAIMMGVTTRDWLADRRLYFWGGFLGMAFFFVAVDPTGVAPIIIAGTMILLFEGTLFLLKWTGR